jgi:hypothetical protein
MLRGAAKDWQFTDEVAAGVGAPTPQFRVVGAPTPVDTIYFDGAAWGMCYYIRMSDIIQQFSGPGNRIVANPKYYGTSSGALAIVLTAICDNSSKWIEWYARYSEEAISKIQDHGWGGVSLSQYQIRILREMAAEYPDMYQQVMNARIHIGITLERSGFKWISHFESNADLMNVLMCTFHIPQLSTYDAMYRGEIAVDGGIGFDVDRFFPGKKNKLTITAAANTRYDLSTGMPLVFKFIPPHAIIWSYWAERGALDLSRFLSIDPATETATETATDTADNVTDQTTNSMLQFLGPELWWVLRHFQSIEYTSNSFDEQLIR